jgi:hypothetical protein
MSIAHYPLSISSSAPSTNESVLSFRAVCFAFCFSASSSAALHEVYSEPFGPLFSFFHHLRRLKIAVPPTFHDVPLSFEASETSTRIHGTGPQIPAPRTPFSNTKNPLMGNIRQASFRFPRLETLARELHANPPHTSRTSLSFHLSSKPVLAFSLQILKPQQFVRIEHLTAVQNPNEDVAETGLHREIAKVASALRALTGLLINPLAAESCYYFRQVDCTDAYQEAVIESTWL